MTCARIDGHDDLPIFIRERFQNHIYDDEFKTPFTKGDLVGHVDLPRLAKGRVGGTFWSVFVQCPANWTDLSDANYATSELSPGLILLVDEGN